jgi:hypothetical protein
MRKALVLMIGFGLAVPGWSQSITIKVNGTKNQQLMVDGKTYSVNNTTGKEKTIKITDLLPGQHALQVVRNNKSNASTSFTTRSGYETIVNIAANGSVHVREKAGSTATSSTRTPMNESEFASLLQKTRNHFRNNSRITAVSTAVANPNYYFTTAQLRMLLESFDGEVNRLELAKRAYPRVTDQMNFATLSSLFTIQDNRDALSTYIRSQGNDIVVSYSETFRTPMRASNFNAILESIEVQWQEGARLSTIIDVFENSSNYFSTAQAMEIIQLVSDESSRLHLAKAVYSRLTDPQNFSTLYALFSDQSYVSSLQAYIGANANNMPAVHNYGKVSMNDSEFEKVYNSARLHFRTSSKLSAVTDFFNNSNNYFTSYQARQMITLLKTESERLQLAKLAYRGIVDPNNFMAQMNDLFSWQASKDELENYVSSYIVK